MPPGITGQWQVFSRKDGAPEMFRKWDTYYVVNWSLWLDLKILTLTPWAVLFGTKVRDFPPTEAAVEKPITWTNLLLRLMPDPPRMKLLVIAMMYEPDCVGIAAIASDMCAALAERGHEVTVYTTYPYYPEWKLKTDAGWRIQEEFIRNVRVRRHRIFVPSKPSRLLPRLIHELSFPASLLRSLFHGKQQDVVMVYCPLMGGVAFAAASQTVVP